MLWWLQASEIRWASRWDTYLMMMDDQIHWFSIINSLMIVLFLSGGCTGREAAGWRIRRGLECLKELQTGQGTACLILVAAKVWK